MQAAEGWSVERVDAGGAAATVLLTGRGPARWAYVPRGPVPPSAAGVDALVEWARSAGLARLRLEPEAPPHFSEELRARGFVPAPAVQPVHTSVVPLGDDEEMLASFKSKHRYNVRLAVRRGVEVAIEDDPGELDRQHVETAQRQGIAAAAVAVYERRLAELPDCHIYVARHQGAALAAIMVARFGGRATYLFGGSSGERRDLMPTYAVQWAAMRDARSAGCSEYDLWGIPPSDDPDHPWHGLWQFKSGFGGALVEYCGAWDLVLRPAAAAVLAAGESVLKRVRSARRMRNIR